MLDILLLLLILVLLVPARDVDRASNGANQALSLRNLRERVRESQSALSGINDREAFVYDVMFSDGEMEKDEMMFEI